ncbi:MAG: type I pullulanase [Bacteroidetes bacterium]|nr:type I pullulanase [Bacteroidota bacterium]
MRFFPILLMLHLLSTPAFSQYLDPTVYPVYAGEDLGLTYSPARSVLKVWSPTATAAEWILYEKDAGGMTLGTHPLQRQTQGIWKGEIPGDQKAKYYTLRVLIDGKWSDEIVDPYVRATGANGKRGQILDLKETNPIGWKTDRSPAFVHKTDAIIYELHVRDASIHPSSGIRQKGKYLGLTERGTKNPSGQSTGLDHLAELGITHVHLLPVFDFYSVDETQPDKKYNWGYDPQNYNVPEGSYATDAQDGAVRIREFKQLVLALHQKGLRVIMDVVYNHTALTEKSNFNQLVPGYYYRQNEKGGFSNASACGNETASERPMFRKFMLESMKYWVEEYHIDGFRIDLMGIHDIETMNQISAELHRIKPDILLYGEGWTAGKSPLPDAQRALKSNAHRLDRIAVFSDDIRDAIKGSVFDHHDKGFVSGKSGMESSIRFGVVAALPHDQVDVSKVIYAKQSYAAQPHHTITYAECHDNHVLADKLAISVAEQTDSLRAEMHRLALGILLTSQGIVFLHAGTEFRRTKKGVENSFESPDSINAIDWNNKSQQLEFYQYVQALIQLRKQHASFRLADSKTLIQAIRFEETETTGSVRFQIESVGGNDKWRKIRVRYSGMEASAPWVVGQGWKPAILNNRVVNTTSAMSLIPVKPLTLTVLYQ